MTEREKLMVETYLPNRRDPNLPEGEYYILDNNERIQQVYISNIYPDMEHDSTTYGVILSKTGKRYRGGSGYDGSVHMYDLYDNKEDCRNWAHGVYDGWEQLRALQEGEQ